MQVLISKTQKYTKSHSKANVYMYRWLVGNLRLWSVISNVSSISNNTRTDTLNKEKSYHRYIIIYDLSSSVVYTLINKNILIRGSMQKYRKE